MLGGREGWMEREQGGREVKAERRTRRIRGRERGSESVTHIFFIFLFFFPLCFPSLNAAASTPPIALKVSLASLTHTQTPNTYTYTEVQLHAHHFASIKKLGPVFLLHVPGLLKIIFARCRLAALLTGEASLSSQFSFFCHEILM